MTAPTPRYWRRVTTGRWELRTAVCVLAEAHQHAGRWRWRLNGDNQEGIAGSFDSVSVAVHRALRERDGALRPIRARSA